MGWNYRVIRTEDAGDPHYAVHECQYAAKGDTIPGSWTEEPVCVLAETRTGLLWVLSKMAEAIRQPVLEVRDGKLVEVEPIQEFSDDLAKALASSEDYAAGMA